MSHKKTIFALAACLSAAVMSLSAQTEQTGASVPVRENEFLKQLTAPTTEEGIGTVRIYQDSRLPATIAERQNFTEENRHAKYITISGYRVQAYSSNVPKTARAEAFSIDAKIKERIPDMATYVSFVSPFWKVRLGDCRTYQEAMTLLNEVKKIFPEYRNNFYIVKEDNIRIPIN